MKAAHSDIRMSSVADQQLAARQTVSVREQRLCACRFGAIQPRF